MTEFEEKKYELLIWAAKNGDLEDYSSEGDKVRKLLEKIEQGGTLSDSEEDLLNEEEENLELRFRFF